MENERPLECSGCQKPIAVRYTTVVDGVLSDIVMCESCPQLEKKLHGTTHVKPECLGEGAGLCCGECGLSLEEVRRGSELGCPLCYEVFSDLLIKELGSAHKIPHREKQNGRLHIGRRPGETKKMTPSVRLIALNEALRETLKREDYEQAAWLRDQIKEIKESDDG